MSENDTSRWHAQKAVESAERHSNDLKKVNDKLRELIESLRSDRERHISARAPTTAPARPAPQPLPEEPLVAGGDAVDLDKRRLVNEVSRLRAQVDEQRREADELRARLTEIEEENRRVCDEALAVQDQTAGIANLYAALFRLHASLDREDVLTAIQEIVINMVGSEELAVFELSPDGQYLDLIRSFGVDPQYVERIVLGEGPIGSAVAGGDLFVAEPGHPVLTSGDRPLNACVPLRLGDKVTGAVAIYRLLGQKAEITPSDRELFELLEQQAARALYLTKLHESRTQDVR
jgi:GAF domain-containing protein